ncbi:MAG: PLDc_N domain-containing protein [Verrucomicrobia bacterium]|nr:PLDc_N domain-containing protein [Verrucomicrobiota bacterium]
MLALLAFWVWMLVDCIRNPRLTDQQRLIWVPVIVFTHWLGALIYLLAGRNPRTGWRPPRRTGIFHSPALISAHESLRRSP